MRLPDSPPALSLEFNRTTWRFWNLDAHFWARPDDRPLNWSVCFLDHDGSLKRALGADRPPHELRERLRATVQNEGFFRAVELSTGERILLHRAQAFALNRRGELARFELRGARWSQTRFLLETPTSTMQMPLERERARAGSDLVTALQWLDELPEQRAFFGLQWTTGDGKTLRHLVYAAFWSCAEMWQAREHCEYRLTATPGAEFGAETSFIDSQGLPRPRFRSAPFALARALQKIVVRNRPFLPRGVRLNREVGIGPLAQRETMKMGTIRFLIGAPNAHEQLEARLDLRDWLRSEAPELLNEWF
ncbi:hypothetical protein IAD21_02397 [Abditibacteriota bacterium]|nr:hypothetical protein IAD21_02397 [Abditibacteriota bacterium]